MTLLRVLRSSKSVPSNSIAVLAINLIGRGARFVSLVVVARFLSPEEFGQYAVIITVTEIFRAVADFGVDVTATKAFVHETAGPSAFLHSAFRAKMLVASVANVLAVGSVLAFGFSGTILYGVGVGAVGFFFTSSSNLLKAKYQATLSMRDVVLPTLAVSFLYLALILLASVIHLNIVALVGLGVICDAVLASYLVWRGYREGAIAPVQSSGWGVQAVIESSLPIGILTIFIVGYARISVPLLARLGGDLAVASYSAAFRVTEAVLAISSAISASLLPVFLKAERTKDGGRELTIRVQTYLRTISSLAFAVALILCLFSGPIITVIFGEAYASSAPTLSVLSLSLAFASSNMVLTNVLYAAERQKAVLFISGFNLILNVLLNLLLIPRFGHIGAAIATSATELANTSVQLFVVSRILDDFWKDKKLRLYIFRILCWVGTLSCYLGFNPSLSMPELSLLLVIGYAIQGFVFGDFVLEKHTEPDR